MPLQEDDGSDPAFLSVMMLILIISSDKMSGNS